MFISLKALFLSLFLFNMTAQAEIKRWVIQNPLESGRVEYIVIEENTALRFDQQAISQKLIYKKRGAPNDQAILNEIEKIKNNPVKISFKAPDRSGKPLWEAVKSTWTSQDEKDYSVWFEANVDERFNIGTTLLADCADVGLLFRWAYAHDKKLPMANTLTGSGKLFGHFSGSSAWDKLPSDPDWRKDERFKQAMRYLFDNTYTRSIFDDLYPTQITSDYVRPGSVYMIIRKDTGHTQTIQKLISRSAGIRTLWGNEPSAEAIYGRWIIWEPAVKNLFGNWRWTTYSGGVWKLVAGKNMPGYSNEQFTKRVELGESDFQTWVLDRLGLVDFLEVKVAREIETVKEDLEYRKNSTAMGSLICGQTSCDPKGEDFDNYSTNTRDARLFQAQDTLMNTINKVGGMTHVSIQKAIASVIGLDDILLAGYDYTYRDFIFNPSLLKAVKAEANLSYADRWGLAQFPNAEAQFLFYNQQLKITMANRVENVGNASYNCLHNICDPLSPGIKALNTAQIDQGFSKLAMKILPLMGSTQIRPALFQEVFDDYRKLDANSYYAEDVASPRCENPAKCSLFDVIWKDDALNRVSTWSSDVMATSNSRWGL